MKPAYAVYVLEVKWVFDHHNTEIATLTVEGCEGSRWQPEYEVLGDPNVGHLMKHALLENLWRLARTLDRGLGSVRMVRLYRVSDHEGITLRSPSSTDLAGGATAEISMKLVPICDFDEQGKPVPLQRLTSRESG